MLLRYKYAAGEVVPYRFTLKTFRAVKGGPGREEELASLARFRVLAVDEASIHLVCHSTPEKYTINGEALPLPRHPAVMYIEMDDCGKPIAFTDASVLLTLILPVEDINPGEKWELRRTLQPGNRQTATEAVDRFTLQAVRDNTAHIAYHFDELTYTGDRPETADQKWTTRGRGAYRFDTALGRLIEMHVENVTTLTVGDQVSQLTTLRDLQLLTS